MYVMHSPGTFVGKYMPSRCSAKILEHNIDLNNVFFRKLTKGTNKNFLENSWLSENSEIDRKYPQTQHDRIDRINIFGKFKKAGSWVNFGEISSGL